MSHEAQIDPMLMEPPTSTNTSMNKRKENLTDEAKYELIGRKLVCLLYPFGSPRTAINVGLKVESGRENELDNDSAEIVQHNRFYEGILTHALGLAEELNNPRMEVKELQDICAWITRGMSDQRSTDLGSVKHAGLGYLFSNGKVLEPSIAKLEDKSMRGFNHPEIARMLCPRKKLDVFNEDPDMIIGALQEGTIRTTAGNWPMCFYEEGVYDPENRAEGLFCGHAAFRFYTHLFIGPSAASTNTVTSSSSKISKNCAWGLTEVTPSIIAYMHVLLYFTLSTAPQWCMAISQMDLAEMAWAIIEMFDDKDDWTKATLAWWNSWAFPKGHGSCKDTDSDDDTAKIRAQQKKAVWHTPNQVCAVEAIGFATPPPEVQEVLSSGNPSIQSSGDLSVPSSGDLSVLLSRDLSVPPSSDSSISSIFSGSASTATGAAVDSNLSPCTSDDEVDSTPTMSKTTDTAVPSTSTTTETSIPTLALSTDSIEPKRKGRAPATKKPRCRGRKKSNRF